MLSVPPDHPSTTTRTFTARREAEKSASSDAHINTLRMVNFEHLFLINGYLSFKFILQHIENRLRLSLPEDIAGSLVDGVILCHMANHVKPRSVPSIHVPSPAVVIIDLGFSLYGFNFLYIYIFTA